MRMSKIYSQWPRKSARPAKITFGMASGIIRGITRKGIKIGSTQNEEGKIFLESNSLAVAF